MANKKSHFTLIIIVDKTNQYDNNLCFTMLKKGKWSILEKRILVFGRGMQLIGEFDRKKIIGWQLIEIKN